MLVSRSCSGRGRPTTSARACKGSGKSPGGGISFFNAEPFGTRELIDVVERFDFDPRYNEDDR